MYFSIFRLKQAGFLPCFVLTEAKSIVIQISIVILIFLSFSGQIFFFFGGGQTNSGVHPPAHPMEESQHSRIILFKKYGFSPCSPCGFR